MIRTTAVLAVVSALALTLYALYAFQHPLVAVGTFVSKEDEAEVAAVNFGRVLGPGVGALLALGGTWAVFRGPDRLGFALTFVGGLFAVYVVNNLPAPLYGPNVWSTALAVLGPAVLILSVVGWFVSAPLPDSPPRWPLQHQAG